MKTVKTPAGIFTINKVKIPSAYTCAAEQKIEYISENHVQIITMNQAVSFGDQILSPRICQSCMNPEKNYNLSTGNRILWGKSVFYGSL